MKDSSTKDIKKSSPTKGLPQHQTTLYLSQTAVVAPLHKPKKRGLSYADVTKGTKFGNWIVVGDNLVRDGGYLKVQVKCTCGHIRLNDIYNLRKGATKGCDKCSRQRKILWKSPQWLINRVQVAKDRCTNTTNANWRNYGGRGITFDWKTAGEAAKWIEDNLGLQRDMEIDRVDNSKGYTPGNLRWATRRQNTLNTRRTRVPSDFQWDQAEWPYSKQRVEYYLRKKLRREQILDLASQAVISKRKCWRQIQSWFHKTNTPMSMTS